MLDWLLKRLRTAPTLSEASADFAHAYVRPAETANRWEIAGRADLLVARMTGRIAIDIETNVAPAEATKLRLYRATTSKKGKRWSTRKPDQKRLKFLRGDLVDRPGGKSVGYAQQAEDFEEVLDGPIIDFLRRPNPWMTGAEWQQLRFRAREATGNTYAWAYQSPGLLEAYFLPPQCVRIVATHENPVALYRFSRNMTDWLDMDPADVFHSKLRVSLQDPRIGDTWVHSLLKEADIKEAATDSELARQRNLSRPDCVVELSGPSTPASREEIKQKLKNEHRGPQQAGNFLVISGATIKPLSWSPKDLEAEKTMRYIDQMIDLAAGIPESMTSNNDASRANGNTGLIQHRRNTILPRLSRDASDMNEFILPYFDVEEGEMWLEYDNCVPEDEDARNNAHIALAGAGIMKIDEARAELGLEAYEDGLGDVPRFNGAPLQSAEQIQADKQAQADALAARASNPQQAKRLARSLLQLPSPQPQAGDKGLQTSASARSADEGA